MLVGNSAERGTLKPCRQQRQNHPSMCVRCCYDSLWDPRMEGAP